MKFVHGRLSSGGGNMNEWFKKVTGKIKDLWSKWKLVQKIIFFAIIVVIIIVIIVAAKSSAKPTTVKVFSQAVTDSTQLTKIIDRLDSENIKTYVSDTGFISVDNEATARKVRALLVSENLVPSGVEPFSASFYNRNWSTTDADQLVKLNKELQSELRNMIISLGGIRDAKVIIVRPEDKLFASEQRPVSAAITIFPSAGSDILSDRKRVQGIQRLILSAVEGLTEDNIVISDENGNQINDFAGMADFDRLTLTEREQKFIRNQETYYTGKILESLQNQFSTDRIRNLNLKIDMDFSEGHYDRTFHSPIQIKADNPDTPYDDSEYRDTLPISQQTVTKEWQGTGYNPEGPAGTEGQTPPVYSDMSNVIGKFTETGVTQNNVMNTTHSIETIHPSIQKFSVSVNVDGYWKTRKDPQTGKVVLDDYGSFVRDYVEVTQKELDDVKSLIEGAISYDRNRGDLVNVTSISIDHRAEWEEEENAYWAEQNRKRTILLVLIVVSAILVIFVLVRIISKELERRRREREARLLAEQQAAREKALWDANEEGMQVSMSVEETRRMELQENAITMAKEHPEDVAMLIRTWLMEE